MGERVASVKEKTPQQPDRGQPASMSGVQRFLLLVSVAICAASGLVYELALISLSTSLNGGSIVETSLIVAGFVAALGLGALLAKPLLRQPEFSFLMVEAALGLLGGVSATVLYVVFAKLGASLLVTVIATLFIGSLVGTELPLLMSMYQRGRLVDARSSGSALATLNVADYIGALLGGLAWPFVLLPWLGLMRGTAASGLLNIFAALVIAAVVLRKFMRPWHVGTVVTSLVISGAILVTLLVGSDGIVTTARQQLYRDPVVYAEQSQYQDIVVTQWKGDRRLFLNGGLQYSTRDEHRYTESLVYPAVTDETENVLIIGGGDGLAARELLRMPQIKSITNVELDPAMVRVANTVLRPDNKGALEDPRVHVVTDDAFAWVRQGKGKATAESIAAGKPYFDTVIVDLSDPDSDTMARLYSLEFYGMLRELVDPKAGRLVVQSGSAFTTPDLFNRVRSTLQAAGCRNVLPFHVHVPTFGDWGFNLCTQPGQKLQLPKNRPTLRFMDDDVLAAAGVFPKDNALKRLEPSTLDHPKIVEDLRRGYRQAGE
ncbi:polyamine aminopropyltransferase [uncultured Corynebacterium sp.]|uniref:polyamine aminopropyltransferase n=1 Tax=uncultured Corynebacterium sp. TaxID=159447 RepID=UPI0025F42398|nr:polyamine aminopropyltransferase [uncultured Corynebacterium sp.]